VSQQKPRKVGRPKLPKGEAKGRTVQVRLTAHALKAVTVAANSSNQILSDWIRSALSAAAHALPASVQAPRRKHEPVTEPMAMDELRAFVQQSTWTFAKTMPKTPHEYTRRKDAPDEALFERVVMHIRHRGYKGRFGKTTYTYFDIDGWQYWTMGSPLPATILINRAKLP
jgi:hypothetical protein